MSLATDKLAYVERLKNRRRTYEPQLQECADYIRPLRSSIATVQPEGSISTRDVFDATARVANTRLGSWLTGTICSQAIKWIDLGVRDEQLNDDPDVRKFFDPAADAMLQAFAQSLFYAEINEVLTDLPGLGTGGIFCDESMPVHRGFNGLYFRAVGVGELAIDEGPEGLVDVVAREFSLSARAALKKWPQGLHARTVDLAAAKPEELVKFVHLVEPREGATPPKVDAQGRWQPVPAKRLPWASYYIEVQNKKLVDEGGYHEMPYAIGRWSRPAGDIYGRGIGHDGLPDVKAVNKSRELFERSWAMAVQPPIKKRRNLQTKVRLVPGGVTECLDPDKDIKEYRTEARFDVAQAGIQDLRGSIREMWFWSDLNLKERPQMTAMEVMARLQLMLQLMGPQAGRLMREILNRLIERAFGIMVRARALPPVPDVLREYVLAQGDWDIEYQGPLARAQRNPELVAIERTIQAETAMSATHPEVRDILKADDALRHIADTAGVPARLVRTEDEVTEIRKRRQAAELEQAELNRAAVLAKAAGDASGMVKALQPAPTNGGGA